MHLKILGKPTVKQPNNDNAVILASYNFIADTVAVSCDADLITIGLAAEVLMQQYKECLEQLDPATARHIKQVIREAVYNEENRSCSAEQRSAGSVGADDGSDGKADAKGTLHLLHGGLV